ncbi:MAG TPA: GNAT family N-acetyltransferase [Longimicrobiaceae bacterium]|nr:GNAT family N-acetyltransferase [Longimicrobiaceae bacterium]
MTPTIHLDEHPSGEDLDRVARGVRDFNRAVAGQEPPRSVGCFLRDEDGCVVGGVWGMLWGSSLRVLALWVDESLRGQRHGATLLRELESYAAGQGYLLAHVETLDFQARPFYERQGYQLFGELEEVAPGHTLYFLRKDLPPAPPS